MTETILVIFALVGAFCWGAAFATRNCRKDIENARKEINKHFVITFKDEK